MYLEKFKSKSNKVEQCITFSSSRVSSPERTIHHCIRRQMMSSQSYRGRKGSGMICVKAKEAKITTGNKHDRACSQPKRTSCFSALMICASISFLSFNISIY